MPAGDRSGSVPIILHPVPHRAHQPHLSMGQKDPLDAELNDDPGKALAVINFHSPGEVAIATTGGSSEN
ncbi:hypothetical protein MJO28_002874 [Puccinia striiformis f. sp. tritici]|uniref:Uncharacterized protein n=1 Tax=Puccinia striiformis f. sp. tritici TaxID=168172 RepID=A0ACC0ES98_9BASI|nr:hypothetical protein MJO28_002874 [Puccinia striiformis f. sp. tritici]